MKIFGIGTDIVRVSRIQKSLKKRLFLSKIFEEQEIRKCKRLKKFFKLLC